MKNNEDSVKTMLNLFYVFDTKGDMCYICFRRVCLGVQEFLFFCVKVENRKVRFTMWDVLGYISLSVNLQFCFSAFATKGVVCYTCFCRVCLGVWYSLKKGLKKASFVMCNELGCIWLSVESKICF